MKPNEITFEFATQDDCLDKMVPSDLRQLVSQRDALEKERDAALDKVEEFANKVSAFVQSDISQANKIAALEEGLEGAKAQVRMWAGSADQIKQERDALKSELSASIQREGEIEKELTGMIQESARIASERETFRQELEEAQERFKVVMRVQGNLIKERDTLQARVAVLETLKDRLDNGIKYDEELNLYVVCWTKREIEEAQEEADKLSKALKWD